MSKRKNQPIANAQCPMPNDLSDLTFLELFIINTICYFDLFDYPLTINEIHQYFFTGGMVGGDYSLLEIEKELKKNYKLKKIITTKRGFYFLKGPPSHKASADKGREEIIKARLEHYTLADKKFKIALRAIKLFKFFPFIKLIAVCNSLAWANARKESDIDLFIITSKNRIWLVRFWSIVLITLLGLRPPKEKVEDKLCLSFYITEEKLDLSQIKISAEDIYLVFWLATLRPVYERDNFYEKLIKANSWLNNYLPNWQAQRFGYRYKIEDNKFNRFIYKVKEFFCKGFFGDWLEKIFKFIEFKLMSQKKKDLAVCDDTRVIITDSMLKFHDNDRRLEFMAEFEKKRKEIIDQI